SEKLHSKLKYKRQSIQGVKLNLKDREGRTALHRASGRGHTAVALALAKAGADIHATDLMSKTPLHLAAQNGHENTVKVLVHEEKKIDTRDGQRKTALYHAVRQGNEKTAGVLLKAGAQVDSVIVDITAALFKAVQKNLDEVVAALIDHGADVNSCNQLGYTPMLLAAELGNAEAFKVLVSKKARLDERLPNQISGLHLAVQSEHGHELLVGLLLETGAKINCLDNNKDTPLHCACRDGHVGTVQRLINWTNGERANLQATNNVNKTALQVAEADDTQAHQNISTLLKKKMFLAK
uniref:CARD- and ANK-containing Inflammasome Adaptor Protein n=1 Tax=Cyprinus carpio TaxID=7962 RepID=A0A8C2CC76_CYPCA